MQTFDHTSGQTFEIDYAKIYCEIIGNQKPPALLILHGGLGNIEDLNAIIPELTKDFKIIGIDSADRENLLLDPSNLPMSVSKQIFYLC